MPPKPKSGQDDTEEEIVVESSKTDTKPKKTRRRKKDNDEYRPSDSEDDDSEEYSDTEEKKEQKPPPSPGDDDKKKKKDVSAPSPMTDDKFDLESGEASEIDDLLAQFPLPSSSRRHIFNENIAMIGSFNIQAFGIKKSSNRVIMKIIADILRSYDIILCQEIHADDDIIKTLAESVSTPATPYTYVLSRSIGRNRYKERYVYLYKKNEWEVMEDYVIDDDDKLGDKFIREPYVVRFQHLKKPNVRITLVGCHTQPDKAFEEIESLITLVYPDVKKKLQRDIVQEKRQLDRGVKPKERNKFHRGVEPKEGNKFLTFFWRFCCCCCPCLEPCFERCFERYGSVSTRDFTEITDEPTNEPIVMMGDFNAAGSYVNKNKRSELDAILKENNLMWGIKHTVDTTVADGPDTAYDRFIFEIANERKWIGNTNVWRFDDGWIKEKSDVTLIKKAAKRVSDHYPIEFELKLK